MTDLLSRIGISRKLGLLTLIGALAVIAVMAVELANQRSTLMAEKESATRALVQTAVSLAGHFHARALVNAGGPAVLDVLRLAGEEPDSAMRLVRGSHIVVPALFDHPYAYFFQLPDGRIFFAIPYERDFTLIGTTDVEHTGAIGEVRIDAGEIAYLCEQASRYFERPVQPADVVWTYSGVRPLLDDESGDPSAVTRDYALELDLAQAPLLSVWGGKITTFRKLAEEAADLLGAPLQAKNGAWTEGAFLPGGDLSGWIGASQRPDTDFSRFVQALALRHPELATPVVRRLARAYGSRVDLLFAGGSLGAQIAPGLYEAELRFLHDHEWARAADDVLWRRSKLGLHYNETVRIAVADWCRVHWGAAAAAPAQR